MSDVFTIGFLTAVLAAGVASGAAILYAALGEVLAERAGVLNLGVEGMMLMGALGGFAVCVWTESAWIGVLGACVVGGLMALIHAVLTISLRANQVVSGLALTLFGTGLSAYLGASLVGRPAPDSFTKLAIPVLSDIPRVGTILFKQDALVYLAYIVVPALWWWVYRTRPGLNLRSVGENPATADAMGLDVNRIRYRYVILGGAFAGLGGAVISLATNPGWTENMTAGRGWIAVALVIFGTWNPARAAAGALLFGAIEAAQFRMQAINVPISSFFLNMTPYIFTIVVLIIATRQTRRMRIGQPAALGVPYVREER
ncbi:MAG TPA: ABC transporter permease [Thermomicrobiales bacterium]|nr:ABC transporter permease [Thermomicrobiales bacterium]